MYTVECIPNIQSCKLSLALKSLLALEPARATAVLQIAALGAT